MIPVPHQNRRLSGVTIHLHGPRRAGTEPLEHMLDCTSQSSLLCILKLKMITVSVSAWVTFYTMVTRFYVVVFCLISKTGQFRDWKLVLNYLHIPGNVQILRSYLPYLVCTVMVASNKYALEGFILQFTTLMFFDKYVHKLLKNTGR